MINFNGQKDNLNYPIQLDLSVVQGDTLAYPLILGCSISGFVYDAYYTYSGMNPLTIIPGDVYNGLVTVGLDNVTTSELESGVVTWQLKYTRPDGFVRTYCQGNFTVKANK
jgi:hypothetical protein